ncbi:hypothetical protein CF70_031725 [Cupriavidus sp. SK-3]|nr:hypothetical protein CF70_031725 [Cupriavidus sp. SK-3]
MAYLVLDPGAMPGQVVGHELQHGLMDALAYQIGGIGAHCGEHLAELVVQLPRQARALAFLGSQQLAAQGAALRLGIVQRTGQVVERTADLVHLARAHGRQAHAVVLVFVAPDSLQDLLQGSKRPSQGPVDAKQ